MSRPSSLIAVGVAGAVGLSTYLVLRRRNRSTKLMQRTAGTSTLKLSTLGLGTWQFGSAESDNVGLEITDEPALEVTNTAVAAGVTDFDTAEDYAKGTKLMQSTAGTSTLKLSTLGFGTWQFGLADSDKLGLEITDEPALELSNTAVAAGVTYFDTAEDYAKGGSEKQLGRILAKLAPELRSAVVIGSKILPNNCGEVRKHCEATLTRLGVNSIDLYMVHWPIEANSMAHFAGYRGREYASTGAFSDTEVPAATKAFVDLMALQREGKVRHIGVSNFGVKQLEAALATGVELAVNQLCYNLIFRCIEIEILPFCRAHGIGVIAYYPLMQGLLTGTWKNADEVPAFRARTRHFDGKRPKSRHGEKGHEALLMATLEQLRGVSTDVGITLADLGLAYLLHKPGVTCVVVGATKPYQVTRDVAAAQLELSQEVMMRLDAATEELKAAMGTNADLWQGLDADGKFDGRIT